MANIFISDFSYAEMPHGGSEVCNQVLLEELSVEFVRSRDIKTFNHDDFYIISNISLMSSNIIKQIKHYNYVIVEHDYKICPSRHPWRYPNNLVPRDHRTNYDLYEHAKAVFVQTQDHMNVFQLNDVPGNFINLKTNIWSKNDLDLIKEIHDQNKTKNGLHCVYKTDNWIKNTCGCVKYCVDNNLNYGFIENKPTRTEFLSDLAKFHRLVFLPLARETFCRLVVEAKCLGLGVLTTPNYGAVLEDYFKLKGVELLDYIREHNEQNIKLIGSFLQK